MLEFMYFELVLTRGMEPAKAVEQLRILMPFSGPDDLPGAELKSAGLRIALPGAPPAAEPPQKPAAADVPPPPAPERK